MHSAKPLIDSAHSTTSANRSSGHTVRAVGSVQAVPIPRHLTESIFRFCDLDHPAVAALFDLALSRRNALLAENDPLIARETRFFQPPLEPGQRRQIKSAPISTDHLLLPEIMLPSPPRIFMQLQEVMADSDVSASDIAEVISTDPSLTARLLRLVNSTYYAPTSSVDSVHRAVAILGMDQLSMLATAMSIMTCFKSIPPELVDMDSFWRHSISTGYLARLIAERAGLEETESYFVTGLLHDIGRLVLFKSSPQAASQAMEAARHEQTLLATAEQEALGCDHSTLGGVLFRKWKLPPDLRLAVFYHHIPEISENVRENGVVHLADIMSRTLGLGHSGEHFVHPLDEAAWDALNLTPTDLGEIADRTLEMLGPLFAAM